MKARLSSDICALLKNRIVALHDLGLSGLLLKAGSNDRFDAGIVLGYSDNDWDCIKKHSGLWKSDKRIKTAAHWCEKLGGHMQQREWMNEIWFCFGQPLTSARSTHNSVETLWEIVPLAIIYLQSEYTNFM